MTKSDFATTNILIFAVLCAIDPSLMADMIRAMIDTMLLGIFLVEGIIVSATPYLGPIALWLVLWYISAKLYLRIFY